jgi:mannan endo-1,6-alpha-mannosidase
MAALSTIGTTLIDNSMVPLSTKTGATSQGNPDAGAGTGKSQPITFAPITTGDKAGAAILTIIVSVAIIGSMIWIVLE